MKTVEFNTYHIKGDQFFYRADGLLGWFIVKIAGLYSHTSRAVDELMEWDAAVEHKGVTLNRIAWERSPVIVPLPWDEEGS